ncbi:MAG: peptidoglycan-binding protein [Fibrobacterota bacterium]|nr:MAG: peptidoglycan-binding protein [Fibrobacterota bacterium]
MIQTLLLSLAILLPKKEPPKKISVNPMLTDGPEFNLTEREAKSIIRESTRGNNRNKSIESQTFLFQAYSRLAFSDSVQSIGERINYQPNRGWGCYHAGIMTLAASYYQTGKLDKARNTLEDAFSRCKLTKELWDPTPPETGYPREAAQLMAKILLGQDKIDTARFILAPWVSYGLGIDMFEAFKSTRKDSVCTSIDQALAKGLQRNTPRKKSLSPLIQFLLRVKQTEFEESIHLEPFNIDIFIHHHPESPDSTIRAGYIERFKYSFFYSGNDCHLKSDSSHLSSSQNNPSHLIPTNNPDTKIDTGSTGNPQGITPQNIDPTETSALNSDAVTPAAPIGSTEPRLLTTDSSTGSIPSRSSDYGQSTKTQQQSVQNHRKGSKKAGTRIVRLHNRDFYANHFMPNFVSDNLMNLLAEIAESRRNNGDPSPTLLPKFLEPRSALNAKRLELIESMLREDDTTWLRLTKNANTRDIQTLLKYIHQKGWYCDPGKVDGVDGPKTRLAVSMFQYTYNEYATNYIQVDGECGPKTWTAFLHTLSVILGTRKW